LIAWEKWPLGWRSFLETICCLLMGDPGRIVNSEWRFHFAGGREQLFAIRYSLFAIRYSLLCSLRRFAQRARIERVVKLGPLPLRAEHALLGAELARRADRVTAGAHRADAIQTDVDDGEPGDHAFEQNLLRRGHHGEPALGVRQQILRGDDD